MEIKVNEIIQPDRLRLAWLPKNVISTLSNKPKLAGGPPKTSQTSFLLNSFSCFVSSKVVHLMKTMYQFGAKRIMMILKENIWAFWRCFGPKCSMWQCHRAVAWRWYILCFWHNISFLLMPCRVSDNLVNEVAYYFLLKIRSKLVSECHFMFSWCWSTVHYCRQSVVRAWR